MSDANKYVFQPQELTAMMIRKGRHLRGKVDTHGQFSPCSNKQRPDTRASGAIGNEWNRVYCDSEGRAGLFN
jgi:hypothetical protein